ncbi:transcription-repair coupling factor [Geobacter metallireducens RCH3]|uniref:Transcription-repair-coupling factor n=1 Tax=Geobacter metallireducens (strain ATCC 53774 / DSM 7210 / GS-15) TaxID=269799 RepID=Q39PS2_GEOMG|nr:transcription-repair coupling factor [Geobacter metallireducens]ABB33752.1 transcription-repair coupling factor [Geobacter metallireducens GS-15]EHP85732.1 transcription-repair coupling factor [Geobacter metallireducens RCH3]
MPLVDSQLIDRITGHLAPKTGRVTLTGLKGSAPAYLLAQLLKTAERPLLVIAPDADRAAEICTELRFFSGRPFDVLSFPAWDVAPFEKGSPHADVTGQRLACLRRLMDRKTAAVVTTPDALRQRVLPRTMLDNASLYFLPGEESNRDEFLAKLVTLGYLNVPLVEDRGTFAVRGGIVDIFPPGFEQPVRIEFFGDFVETIRAFDPLSQRSLAPLEELLLLPSREMVLTDEVLKSASHHIKARCDELEISPVARRELLEQLQQGLYPTGVEWLLPLFHPRLETLFDYAGDAVRVVLDPEALAEEDERFDRELVTAEDQARERGDLFASPAEFFLTASETAGSIEAGRLVTIPYLTVTGESDEKTALALDIQENTDLKVDVSSDSERILKPLVTRLNGWLEERQRVIVACHQRGQAQRLYELLSHYPLPLNISDRPFPAERERDDGKVDVVIGDLSRGFRLPEEKLIVIAEEEIFGRRQKRRGVSELRKKQIMTSLAELKPGDYMVHLDHGIGIYRGLQHISLSGCAGDFILLEYAGGDKLYLPVDRLNLVQRYVGAEGLEPRVDKLGGTSWEKAKGKARAAVQEMAGELLQIYAARQLHEGHAFSPPDDLYREFEASFAYEETSDQMSAIMDVIGDMTSAKPMDRLVCGDVGYGKTEVAMRGAFKAVMDGKQVAVLVPTTVLAQQHLETFKARLGAYPVTVEMLSRFRTPKEQKEILEKVKKGAIDVIIGTHRLLQSDVTFKDLGLLIVDEEQRFGVTHKEKLKKYKAVVDILTLTATPIPRTLYMSMMGIRDLSIIDTPPVDRLAVKTFVARSSDDLIREAVMRELRRGGQIFFVHNRVQSIMNWAEHLRRIVPEAKIAVGHGQMDEGELEKVMLGFMHGETNLLLCTTIIESGLDIPNANTLIIDRADTFGLAQLYQLRGRVGRSKQRAYAYLLIPGEGAISSDARERLKIIQELTELGAGFRLATHDLEIRGAGDILGAKQSGNIAAVGFDLYTELLEEAIQNLKGEERLERVEPEINLRIPAFVPEDYVREPNQRLIIYKKLTQAESEEEVDEVMAELVDRFGKLPLAATYLLEVMKLRIHFKRFLITMAEFDGRRLCLSFHQKTPVPPDTIIGLIRSNPKRYQFSPDFRLTAELADTSFEGVLEEARNLLKRLG